MAEAQLLVDEIERLAGFGRDFFGRQAIVGRPGNRAMRFVGSQVLAQEVFAQRQQDQLTVAQAFADVGRDREAGRQLSPLDRQADRAQPAGAGDDAPALRPSVERVNDERREETLGILLDWRS